MEDFKSKLSNAINKITTSFTCFANEDSRPLKKPDTKSRRNSKTRRRSSQMNGYKTEMIPLNLQLINQNVTSHKKSFSCDPTPSNKNGSKGKRKLKSKHKSLSIENEIKKEFLLKADKKLKTEESPSEREKSPEFNKEFNKGDESSVKLLSSSKSSKKDINDKDLEGIEEQPEFNRKFPNELLENSFDSTFQPINHQSNFEENPKDELKLFKLETAYFANEEKKELVESPNSNLSSAKSISHHKIPQKRDSKPKGKFTEISADIEVGTKYQIFDSPSNKLKEISAENLQKISKNISLKSIEINESPQFITPFVRNRAFKKENRFFIITSKSVLILNSIFKILKKIDFLDIYAVFISHDQKEMLIKVSFSKLNILVENSNCAEIIKALKEVYEINGNSILQTAFTTNQEIRKIKKVSNIQKYEDFVQEKILKVLTKISTKSNILWHSEIGVKSFSEHNFVNGHLIISDSNLILAKNGKIKDVSPIENIHRLVIFKSKNSINLIFSEGKIIMVSCAEWESLKIVLVEMSEKRGHRFSLIYE